jgi:hypothetical protein
MSLILCPFVGFAIHGKVDEAGLFIGLLIAVIPLCGLIALVILRWLTWRKLPSHIIEERKFGRVIPAEGARIVVAPVRFSNKKNKNDWIKMQPKGITLSRHALLRMTGVPNLMATVWVTEQTQELFVAWLDIIEWVVDTDSDGPNYYLLNLRSKGRLSVRRFETDIASECDLLDAVRSIGKVPVRLRCDVDCE